MFQEAGLDGRLTGLHIPVSFVVSCRTDGLERDRSARIEETREGDEVPLQGTLVLCGPGRKRLKADDVRTSTEWIPPQSSSGQVGTWSTIAAHLTVSS
jgi:hypothetical protein